VLGDNMVYIVWLPILLASKGLAPRFHRFTRVDPRRIEMLEKANAGPAAGASPVTPRDFLCLLFLGCAATLAAGHVARWLHEFPPVLTAGSWKILLVTTFGLLLSATPARALAGSQEVGMALLYLFIAQMGARANLSGLQAQAVWFVLAAYLWVTLHGAMLVLGARLLRADLHSTAIASVANIGGVAGVPLVAAHHNPRLVPVGILMALLGYALGNYGGFLAAWLCHQVS
jgi:uncharacterized membrane protein